MSGLMDIVLGAAGLIGQPQAMPRPLQPFETGDGTLIGTAEPLVADAPPTMGSEIATSPQRVTDEKRAVISRIERTTSEDMPAARQERTSATAREATPAAPAHAEPTAPKHVAPLETPKQASPLPHEAAPTAPAAEPTKIVTPRGPAPVHMDEPTAIRASIPTHSQTALKPNRQLPQEQRPQRLALSAQAPAPPATVPDPQRRVKQDHDKVDATQPLQPRLASQDGRVNEALRGPGEQHTPQAVSPTLEISIGRISIEYAKPPEPTPRAIKPAAATSRGFADYHAARRGRLR